MRTKWTPKEAKEKIEKIMSEEMTTKERLMDKYAAMAYEYARKEWSEEKRVVSAVGYYTKEFKSIVDKFEEETKAQHQKELAERGKEIFERVIIEIVEEDKEEE